MKYKDSVDLLQSEVVSSIASANAFSILLTKLNCVKDLKLQRVFC